MPPKRKGKADPKKGKKAKTEPKIKLMYFGGRGLAEVPRMLLHAAEVEFEDVRLTSEEFATLSKEGKISNKNFGRLPLLSVDDTAIGQSGPISRYLAKKYGWFGSSLEDEAEIDNLCECIKEIMDLWRKCWPYGAKLSDEDKKKAFDTFFDTPAEHKDDRSNRQLPWILQNIEEMVGDDGFSFGGSPSLADVYLYNLLGEHDASLGEAGEPFNNKAKTDKAVEASPKIKKIIETFKAHGGIEKYLESRPKNAF
eukprot:gb/GEZN01011498.1/.p1 GENE.gb/GEZN01011498.1/~~gb/GEZN01011498.1/.p1  ORF type:complete len:253 (+),score=55.24 gb/GEZN01011498.1/:55-813(+)